ncbi:hypothetical protein SALBM217S_08069 [Streptomyces griseoloalbus]
MEFRQSSKLSEVCYEIRGPVIEHANALEEAGHSVLRLNTGNPALFGFEAPEEILQDMIRMSRRHTYEEETADLLVAWAARGGVRHRRPHGAAACAGQCGASARARGGTPVRPASAPACPGNDPGPPGPVA